MESSSTTALEPTGHIGRIREDDFGLARITATLFAALAITACSTRAEEDLADFRKFVDEREACEHFAGEIPDPPDAERMKEVLEQIQLYCAGTDARLAALKSKYANNIKVMSKLNEYDEIIERARR